MKTTVSAEAAKIVADTTIATTALMGKDIGYMQKDISLLQTDMKLVLENHLPHIKEDIANLSTKITMYTAINIVVFILGIITVRLLK